MSPPASWPVFTWPGAASPWSEWSNLLAEPLLLLRFMRAAIFAFASLTACVPADFESDPADNPSNPTNPTDPAPPAPIADGTYQVRSQYDVTAEAVLPQPAFEMVTTLRSFSAAPAHTLLDVAEDAGVPAVGTIRDALPSSLESRLEGWIDEQIEKVTINGVPVTQIAGEIAALAETVLTQFAIDSELVLDGTTATHRLTKIDFAPAGVDVAISLADLPSAITRTTATCTVDHAALVIGDHRYGLPYGQFAWSALEAQITAEYGKPVRALLGDAINCPAVAQAVATKCVLSLCVGHKAELTEICERGVDEVVAVARRKFEALTFEAIRNERGTATLVDGDHDGRFDTMTGGVWKAQINASQGLRAVPATFTASR